MNEDHISISFFFESLDQYTIKMKSEQFLELNLDT